MDSEIKKLEMKHQKELDNFKIKMENTLNNIKVRKQIECEM